MFKRFYIITLSALVSAGTSGCSTMRSFFAAGPHDSDQKPISNPFAAYSGPGGDSGQNIILRTKKGDRAVEVELPRSSQDMTDFVIPVSPAFRDTDRGLASVKGDGSGVEDGGYQERAPGISDREITASFPQGAPEDEGKRREVENSLGLVPVEDNGAPAHDRSYLAALDHVKQLYRSGRYEAALIEADGLVQQYQTDPKLYEMRGTLLDRLGKTDLAIKSWQQALRFDPKNLALKKFVERKQQNRSVASP